MTAFLRRKRGSLYFSEGPGHEHEWSVPDPRIGYEEERGGRDFGGVYVYLAGSCPTTELAVRKLRAIRAASKLCNGKDTEKKGRAR